MFVWRRLCCEGLILAHFLVLVSVGGSASPSLSLSPWGLALYLSLGFFLSPTASPGGTGLSRGDEQGVCTVWSGSPVCGGTRSQGAVLE